MKKLFMCVTVLGVIVISCGKKNDLPEPTASFKITNTERGSDSVWEGTTVNIVNNSKFAGTYLWDFGNGTTSTEREPKNIDLWPCTTTVTVTLTAKNEDGVTAKYSQAYYVICGRRRPSGTHTTH